MSLYDQGLVALGIVIGFFLTVLLMKLIGCPIWCAS